MVVRERESDSETTRNSLQDTTRIDEDVREILDDGAVFKSLDFERPLTKVFVPDGRDDLVLELDVLGDPYEYAR
jgi:hypothetical protein